MLDSIGVVFEFKGANAAAKDMELVVLGFSRLSKNVDSSKREIDRATGGIISRLTAFAGQSRSTAAQIAAPFALLSSKLLGVKTMLAGAGAAFVGAGLLGIPYKLAAAGAGKSLAVEHLRALRMSDDDIKETMSGIRRFTNEIGGFASTELAEAFYEVQSTVGDLAAKQKMRIMEVSLLGGKATKMAAKEAVDLSMNLWGATREHFKNMDPVEFMEMWWAKIDRGVALARLTGEKLKQSLVQALPLMAQAKWTPAQMVGAVAALQKAGFKPEMAGTLLRNVLSRSREGLGEMLSQHYAKTITGRETGWDELKGDAKKQITQAMEQAIDESGLLKGKGPVPLFSALNKILSGFSEGKGEGLIKKSFGEETIAGVLTLKTQLGYMKEIIDEMDKSGFAGLEKHARTRLNEGIHNAMRLMEQRWGNFRGMVGDMFAPAVEGALNRISAKFVDWQRLLEERGPEIGKALTAGFEGFSSALGDALKSIPVVKELLDTIAGPEGRMDTDKWRKAGQEMGDAFGGLAKTLWDVASGMKAVHDKASALFNALGFGQFRGKEGWGGGYGPTWAGFLNQLTRWWTEGGENRLTPRQMDRIFGGPSPGLSERAPGPEAGMTPMLPGGAAVSPQSLTMPGPGRGLMIPAMAMSAPSGGGEPKVNLQMVVRIGDRDITDFIIEQIKVEMDRHGLGHGDQGLGWAYM